LALHAKGQDLRDASRDATGETGASPHQLPREAPLHGRLFSKSCPKAAGPFVRISNMNTDYGFFHLFNALKSLRNNKGQPKFGKLRSEVEVELPKIDYAMLATVPVQTGRYEQHEMRWQHLDVPARGPVQYAEGSR
jgi:hypothetical protein